MIDPYIAFTQEHPELAGRIQLLVERGRLHLEQGQRTEARKDFQHALTLFPHVPAALNNLALLAFGEGDMESAKAYIDELLDFDAQEPTALALLARYWYERGSLPLARRAAHEGINSALDLVVQNQSSDPTRLRRSIQFIFQSLAALEADSDIIRLHSKVSDETLMPPLTTQVGRAYYNQGDFALATELWQQAAAQGFTPAQLYLDMSAVVQAHQLIPFHLDSLLELPQPEKGRQIWLSHVPTLFAAAALVKAFRGLADEVEEALSLLVQANIPGLELILQQVAVDITRSDRLRMLACLHLFAANAPEKAAQLMSAIPVEGLVGEDLALWALVQGLIAEGEGRAGQAAVFAAQGCTHLTGELSRTGQAFRAMLEALAGRCGQTTEVISAIPATRAETSGKYRLHLPDADWLRQALLGTISTQLEEALARKQRTVVDELARRLGEAQPAAMPTDALVRRVAVRMRSLQLEKVLRALSAAARPISAWLAAAKEPVMLPQLWAYADARVIPTDLWAVLEELYRAGLIDVGYIAPAQAAAARDSDQLAVVVPVDLRTRLANLERQ